MQREQDLGVLTYAPVKKPCDAGHPVLVTPWVFIGTILAALVYASPDSSQTSDSSVVTLDTLTVRAVHGAAGEEKSIAELEEKYGMTSDLNNLLFMNAGVARVPEAGSSLLINGESAWDNRYFVYHVPLFAPSHFADTRLLDRSSIMVNALDKATIVTTGGSGRFADASGGAVLLEPGIVRYADPRSRPFPELEVNLGNIRQDFALSAPFADGRDIYQAGFTNSNGPAIRDRHRLGTWSAKPGSTERTVTVSDEEVLGYGVPESFGDAFIMGAHERESVRMKEHVWLAYDSYRPYGTSDRSFLPWGVAAVAVEDAGHDPAWKVHGGGSVQHHFAGKLDGTVAGLVSVERRNLSLFAEHETTLRGLTLTNNAHVEALDWHGTGRVLIREGSSMSAEHDSILVAGDREAHIHAHSGIGITRGATAIKVHALAGYLSPASFFLDPGLRFQHDFSHASCVLTTGIGTSFPDIRGLPDFAYRRERIKTYTAGATIRVAGSERLYGGVEVYGKWKDRAPRTHGDPTTPWYDPSLDTPLLIRGANLQLEADVLSWLTLRSLQNISHSDRITDTGRVPYEWSIPWTNRTVAHIHVPQSAFSFYLTGVFAEGMLYRPLVMEDGRVKYGSRQKRLPDYKRIDFKIELVQKVDGHPHLTRYDAYVDFIHLLNLGVWKDNTRGYYWDEEMRRHALPLDHFMMSFGARIGLKW